MAWSFRSDLVAGIYQMLVDFQTANSTALDGVYRSRPKAFTNRPLAYVGSRNEGLQHTSGIHRRNVTPTVVIVYAARDYADEMADVRDDVVDAFLEYASDRPHATTTPLRNTLVEPRTTEDVELEMDGSYYPATIVTFAAVQQVGADTGA
jgi:hypothetical protein